SPSPLPLHHSFPTRRSSDLLGISRSLVGFAINGCGHVNKETRERIMAEAERMGYNQHSNGSARDLIARRYNSRVKTGTLAVIFGDRKSTRLNSSHVAISYAV